MGAPENPSHDKAHTRREFISAFDSIQNKMLSKRIIQISVIGERACGAGMLMSVNCNFTLNRLAE